jgi:protocatechuate 3,4-dioxygenase alpha subunit
MMEKLEATPSQTVGPFFAYSLSAEQYGYPYNSIVNDVLLDERSPDDRIYIKGRVFDGAGAAITDALIELWQADGAGQYRSIPVQAENNGFIGFGRMGTAIDGQFSFTTLKPGPVNGQAPHINIILFMRGSLRALFTRLYFSDEEEANANDRLLNKVPAERWSTLIAQKDKVNDTGEYIFNIHMQGEHETIFFELQ